MDLLYRFYRSTIWAKFNYYSKKLWDFFYYFFFYNESSSSENMQKPAAKQGKFTPKPAPKQGRKRGGQAAEWAGVIIEAGHPVNLKVKCQ